MDKLPTLDNLINQFGTSTVTPNNAVGPQTYALLDAPAPITGPNFDHYQDSREKPCVAAYVLRVNEKNEPAGTVRLAVWTNVEAYHLGKNPAAMLNVLASGVY